MEVMVLALQLAFLTTRPSGFLALERIICLVTRSNNKGIWAEELGSLRTLTIIWYAFGALWASPHFSSLNSQ